MKNILFFLQLTFAAVLIFTSCSKEPVDTALSSEVPTACNTPGQFAVSTLINDNIVQIDWDKTSGEAWEIQYGPQGFEVGTGVIVDFTPESTSISGLSSTINYEFYIRTKCGEGIFSAWFGPVAAGAELTACVSPTNLSALRLATDPSKINVTWLANGDENSWQIQYGTAGFSLGTGTILLSANNSKMVSNLLENASYEFYVRSNCSNDQNSNWIGPVVVVAVPIEDCIAPSNVTVIRNGTNSSKATVSWNAGGSETSWEIQYGNAGFVVGNGTSVISEFTTINVNELQTSSYDFYVRANCSATQSSPWFGPINLEQTNGIDNTTALMTANIAGIQYDRMTPYQYATTGTDVIILNNNAPISEPRYLWIQGVTSDNLVASSDISLYLPNNTWVIGDYPLLAFDNVTGANFCQVKLLTNPGSNISITNRISEGRITITEFNRDTRIVKGLFSFSYEKFVDGTLEGGFRVLNGTFSYQLDDSYFN